MSGADAHLAELERFAESRPAGEPAWLPALRKSAAGRFAELGFPTPALEDWRTTNLAALARRVFPLAPAAEGSLTRETVEALSFPVFACSLYVFVNGRFVPALSSPKALSGSVAVTSLAQAIERSPSLVEPHLARLSTFDDRALVALNTAFLADGAFVHVPAGETVAAPIHVVWVSVPGEAGAMTHPRTLVVAEPGSRAAVIEDYLTLGPGTGFTNAVTEIAVGEDAALDHVKLQREGDDAFHLSAIEARLARGARFGSHSIALGAGLARTDLCATLAGEGADCTLNGLYVATGVTLVDHHTTVDHATPRGGSRQLYKGLLGGRARGVFNGRVIVREGAQHTDSKQTNRNLLLSDDASVSSKPQLEIAADDVKCSHGSSIGSLDEDALFYLRARGIDEPAARGILSRAFASEIVDAIPVEPLRERVHELVLQRLAGSLPAPEGA